MGPPKTPLVAVDIIIELPDDKVLLIERRNEPLGWALPGGFVDVGESIPHAAMREAKEETSLEVDLTAQLHCYGAPDRDPRGHTVSIVYVAKSRGGTPRAADDAKHLAAYSLTELPPLAFDHARILSDYAAYRRDGRRPGAEV
jgi:8-oxo-dGTP diphosphatase